MAYQTDDMDVPRETEEALGWYMRLSSGNATEQDWVAHAEWLAASPSHIDAFAAVQHTFERIDAAGNEIRAKYAVGVNTSRKASEPRFQTSRRGWGFVGRRPLIAAGAIAAVLALVIVSGLSLKQVLAPNVIRYATAAGQVSHVMLPDGSAADLDTNTVLLVSYSSDLRSADLAHGRVIFDVQHNPARPFVVKASDHMIRVLGTKFEVAARDNSVAVAVVRGLVDVTSNAGLSAPPAKVAVGEKLIFSQDSATPRRERVDPQNIGSWTERRLVFDATPLAKVLEEVNRYFPGIPIRVASADLATLVFTGSIYLDDEEMVARNLSSFMSLNYERDSKGFVLKRPTPNKSGA